MLYGRLENIETYSAVAAGQIEENKILTIQSTSEQYGLVSTFSNHPT